MSAPYFNIEVALIAAVKAAAGATPVDYPDAPLKDKPDGLWLKMSNLRGQSAPVTLGDIGEDNHPGVLQIDINYPRGQGSGAVLNKADELTNLFPAGSTFTNNGQAVTLMGTSLSGGRYVGGYYRVSLSIKYYARSTRR